MPWRWLTYSLLYVAQIGDLLDIYLMTAGFLVCHRLLSCVYIMHCAYTVNDSLQLQFGHPCILSLFVSNVGRKNGREEERGRGGWEGICHYHLLGQSYAIVPVRKYLWSKGFTWRKFKRDHLRLFCISLSKDFPHSRISSCVGLKRDKIRSGYKL